MLKAIQDTYNTLLDKEGVYHMVFTSGAIILFLGLMSLICIINPLAYLQATQSYTYKQVCPYDKPTYVIIDGTKYLISGEVLVTYDTNKRRPVGKARREEEKYCYLVMDDGHDITQLPEKGTVYGNVDPPIVFESVEHLNIATQDAIATNPKTIILCLAFGMTTLFGIPLILSVDNYRKHRDYFKKKK